MIAVLFLMLKWHRIWWCWYLTFCKVATKRYVSRIVIRDVPYAYQAYDDGYETASTTFSQAATVDEIFLPNTWGYNDFFCASARACNDKDWRLAA